MNMIDYIPFLTKYMYSGMAYAYELFFAHAVFVLES